MITFFTTKLGTLISAALSPKLKVPSIIPGSSAQPADIYLPRWEKGRPSSLEATVISPLQISTINDAATIQSVTWQSNRLVDGVPQPIIQSAVFKHNDSVPSCRHYFSPLLAPFDQLMEIPYIGNLLRCLYFANFANLLLNRKNKKCKIRHSVNYY